MEELQRQAAAMARYALDSGRAVAGEELELLERPLDMSNPEDPPGMRRWHLEELRRLHDRLTAAVWPAQPQALMVLHEQRAKRRKYQQAGGARAVLPRMWYALGPVPVVRVLVMFAVLLLVGFVATVGVAATGDGTASLSGATESGGSNDSPSGAAPGGGGRSGGGRGIIAPPASALKEVLVTARFHLPAARQIRPELTQDAPTTTAASSNVSDWAATAALIVAAALGATFEALYRVMEDVRARTYLPAEDGALYLRVVVGILAGFLLVMALPPDTDLGMTPTGLAILGGFGAPVVYRVLARLVASLEDLIGGPSADAAGDARRDSEANFDQRRREWAQRCAGIRREAEQQAPTAMELRRQIDELWGDLTRA